jgi:hypothetical protein
VEPAFPEDSRAPGPPVAPSQPTDSAAGIVAESATAVEATPPASVALVVVGETCPPWGAPVSDLTVTRAPPPVDNWTVPAAVSIDGSDSATTMAGGPSAG